MIPVANPIDEPPLFDANCRMRGKAWLAANPTRDCHAAAYLWRPFAPDLRKGFERRCGYLGVKLHCGGVVDHFVSCAEDRTKAFDWDNYRYASETVNSRKQALDKKKVRVLDPFAVQPGWFEVLLPSFELVLTSRVPADVRAVAQMTIEELDLGKGYQAREARWSAYESHYHGGRVDLAGLRLDAPLVADAVAAWLATGKPLPAPNDHPVASPPVVARKRTFAPRKRAAKKDAASARSRPVTRSRKARKSR